MSFLRVEDDQGRRLGDGERTAVGLIEWGKRAGATRSNDMPDPCRARAGHALQAGDDAVDRSELRASAAENVSRLAIVLAQRLGIVRQDAASTRCSASGPPASCSAGGARRGEGAARLVRGPGCRRALPPLSAIDGTPVRP